ncbi:MAG: hypothetical protein ISR74_06955 [Candidatus Thioglobus sp.]|nr:hypothetical protein [Candidatus Thioglobus sp.]
MQESTIVSINHNGEYFINSLGEDNSEVSKGEKQSLGVIAGRVRARLEIYPSMKVFVRGDANVAYGSVVSLMSFLQKNGVDEIRLISTIDKTRDKRLAELKRAEKRVENERYKVQQRLKKLKAKVKQEKQAKAKAEKNRKDAEQKIKLALKKKRLPEKKAKEAEASKFEKKNILNR